MHNRLITIVEKELKLPEGSIIDHTTNRDVCIGRYICYRYLHEEHKWSASSIAKSFRHSRRNVFYGIMTLRNIMEFDEKFRHLYSRVFEKIEGASFDTPSVDME